MYSHSKNNILPWVILLGLSLVWGSSFILIKKALILFTPVEVGAARIGIAGLAFLPLAFRFLPRIQSRDLPALIVVGACGSAIPAFLYAFAQQNIDSSIAGILNSLTPVFTFFLGIIFFRQRFNKMQLLGLILGFLASFIIVYERSDSSMAVVYLPIILIFIATINYGISANTVQLLIKRLDALTISCIGFGIVAIPCVLYLVTSTDFLYKISNPQGEMLSVFAMLFLSFIGTFLSSLIFFKLIGMTNALFGSVVAFIIPFIALIWGAVDGESITFLDVLALLIMLGGILLIKKYRS